MPRRKSKLISDLEDARKNQQKCGDYIRAFRNYPEWLGDCEGAKRGAEDNLMEELLILRELEPNWFPGTEGTHYAGLPLCKLERGDDDEQ